MKNLIVALLVLTPFIGVSQDVDSTYKIWHVKNGYLIQGIEYPKPDTISAYLLVTTRQMGIAYQKRGFVVRQYGKDDVFLDCEKRAIKQPFNVWSFRIINQPK